MDPKMLLVAIGCSRLPGILDMALRQPVVFFEPWMKRSPMISLETTGNPPCPPVSMKPVDSSSAGWFPLV